MCPHRQRRDWPEAARADLFVALPTHRPCDRLLIHLLDYSFQCGPDH